MDMRQTLMIYLKLFECDQIVVYRRAGFQESGKG